jgi:hypothetical protein
MYQYTLDIYGSLVKNNKTLVSEELGSLVKIYNSYVNSAFNDGRLTMTLRLNCGIYSLSLATFYKNTYITKENLRRPEILDMELEML